MIDGYRGIGRKARYPDVDDLPLLQLNDKKCKERPEAQVSDMQEIAGPDLPSMIAQEGCPTLPSGARRERMPHVLLNRSFADVNPQLQQLATNPFRSPESVVPCHFLN